MTTINSKITSKSFPIIAFSDSHYLELKHQITVLTKLVKQIADKTGVEIDLAELEKF